MPGTPKLPRARGMMKGDSLSNTSSRSVSRARTPTADGEENGQLDFNFQSIEDLLSRKLDSLQSFVNQQDDGDYGHSQRGLDGDHKQKSVSLLNNAFIKSGSTGINDILVSLSKGRTEVSSQSRELLLAQLYKLIVSKPIAIYNEETQDNRKKVTEKTVDELLKVFSSGDYRSESEFLLLFRSVTAIIVGNIEEFSFYVSSDTLSKIEKFVQDPPSSIITIDNKANLITGYVGLLLVLHNGSSAFGIDDKIEWLLEVAEGFSKSAISKKQQVDAGDREHSTYFTKDSDLRLVSDAYSASNAEASLAIAALHGAGCLLTLLSRGEYLNEFIIDKLPLVVELLDNDESLDISKAAGRFIALSYEIYTYDDGEEEDVEEDKEFNSNAPYYEQEAILSTVNRLANLSSKKTSKKDRKQSRSIFSDVENTIKCFTNSEDRNEIYKKSFDGLELQKSLIDNSFVKLSKSKLIAINSWFLYIRLIHLKWCFSFGLHNQLVGNESIRDILREPQTYFQQKYGLDDEGDDALEGGSDRQAKRNLDERRTTSEKKRTEKIRKERVNKLSEEVEDLNIK